MGDDKVMAESYRNDLKELSCWVGRVKNKLFNGEIIALDSIEANIICRQINTVADGIAKEYSFYTAELRKIAVTLFLYPTYASPLLNDVVFGELSVIVRHIEQEPVNPTIWNNIHPRIAGISRNYFCDGYYGAAAQHAVKEVEVRLRELFRILNPDRAVPHKIGDIIGALISENGAYDFADLSTPSGKSYRRGVQLLVEGIQAAYRNPAAHGNVSCTEREAVEQIMLASQLMYVLDKDNTTACCLIQ